MNKIKKNSRNAKEKDILEKTASNQEQSNSAIPVC